MKKWICGAIASGLVSLASLWLGAWLLSMYPPGTWQGFPIFGTAFVCGIGGVAGVALCCAEAATIWNKRGGAK